MCGDLVGVDVGERKIIRAVRKLHIGDHLCEFTVEAHLFDAFTEAVAGFAFDVVGVCDQLVEAAVLFDPFLCGFFADAGDVGQVIGWIAT